MTDGRVFRHWTHARAFKAYWLETARRVGIQNLRFHDLRHTFTTRLQRMGVDYELRQALLGHRMPGMTADYSHGGPEWDARLRDAISRLEKGYALVDGLADERPRAKVVGANYAKNGEPAGARTRDPRLKRAMLYQLSYRLTEQRARILPLTLGPCLARIIHDTSAASMNARLRRTVSSFSPSTCCASMPQGVIAPSTRLMRVCTLYDEPS